MHENGQSRQGTGALGKGAGQVNRYGAVRQSKWAKVPRSVRMRGQQPLDCPPTAPPECHEPSPNVCDSRQSESARGASRPYNPLILRHFC